MHTELHHTDQLTMERCAANVVEMAMRNEDLQRKSTGRAHQLLLPSAQVVCRYQQLMLSGCC
jgi:hypothetical protein